MVSRSYTVPQTLQQPTLSQQSWVVNPPRSKVEARTRMKTFQNEYLDAKLDATFERLWRDQAPGPKGEEVSTPEEYLQGYFRQVSALHRECIYSAHRRELLEQKKLDVECGLVRGCVPDILKEIEEAKEQHDKAEQLIRECMQRVALGAKGKNADDSGSGCGGGCKNQPCVQPCVRGCGDAEPAAAPAGADDSKQVNGMCVVDTCTVQ